MKTQKERYFRVRYGFGKSDTVSIPESKLEKAVFAKLNSSPTVLDGEFIEGKHIINIRPDFHKHTGWYPSYEPTGGDDFAQIKRDCPDYDGILEYYTERVNYLMVSERSKEIGTGVELSGIIAPEQKRIGYE